MIKPVKHDKRTKHKISKGLVTDITAHPFTLASIIAAIAIVVWVILFDGLRFINQGAW